jgi:hypothetical protein
VFTVCHFCDCELKHLNEEVVRCLHFLVFSATAEESRGIGIFLAKLLKFNEGRAEGNWLHAEITRKIQVVIAHVRDRYRPRWFFLHGFSLGAYMAIRYSVFDGILCASHTFHGIVANGCLLKFVQKRLYFASHDGKVDPTPQKKYICELPCSVESKDVGRG